MFLRKRVRYHPIIVGYVTTAAQYATGVQPVKGGMLSIET